MGLTGCYALLKYLVVLVNLIFWLAGLAVITFAVWLWTDSTFYVSMARDEVSYYTGIYILLAAGALLFIIGFLGCCGAYRESPCMLVSFFCFLLIIFVAEIAAGAWAYNNSDRLKEYVEDNVKFTVRDEYGMKEIHTTTFDSIQRGLQCCGASGPRDWATSKINNKEEKTLLDLAVTSVIQQYKIPDSCCREEVNLDLCRASLTIGIAGSLSPAIYSEGCAKKLIDMLMNHVNIVLGIGIGIAIIECLGLIFSLILCCGIRNMDRYKA